MYSVLVFLRFIQDRRDPGGECQLYLRHNSDGRQDQLGRTRRREVDQGLAAQPEGDKTEHVRDGGADGAPRDAAAVPSEGVLGLASQELQNNSAGGSSPGV